MYLLNTKMVATMSSANVIMLYRPPHARGGQGGPWGGEAIVIFPETSLTANFILNSLHEPAKVYMFSSSDIYSSMWRPILTAYH